MQTSRVGASREAVWGRVGTLRGANAEMGPWLRLVGLDPDRPLERPLDPEEVAALRLRALRVVPLGRYPLGLRRVSAPAGFLEQTTSGPFARWQHERTLVADGSGTLVTDALAWELRRGVPRRADRVVELGVRRFFAHRHRRLRRAAGT